MDLRRPWWGRLVTKMFPLGPISLVGCRSDGIEIFATMYAKLRKGWCVRNSEMQTPKDSIKMCRAGANGLP